MNQLIQELSFQEQPLHVFQHNGKVAFLTKEVGEILGISKPTQSLRQSKTLQDGIDYSTIPTISLGQRNNLFPAHQNQVSILYLSGFFLFVLRSNKPIAVPFTRWAIREILPEALLKKQQPKLELSEATLVKLVMEERKGSGIARQILSTHGWKDPTGNRQLTFDDDSQGGNHDHN